jgi:hypothetical protein
MLVENMFDGEHPSSTYGLPFYPTEMALSIDVSQVPGASCTVMDCDEQRVCHVDVNRRHQCNRSCSMHLELWGRGLEYEMAIAKDSQ